MRRLKRFVRLQSSEKLLVLHTAFVMGTAWIALQATSARSASRLVQRAAGVATHDVSVEQVARAGRIVSRCLPSVTCLTQALAAHAMLSSAGHESLIQIGVTKDSVRFEAHAWVVCKGEIVVGGTQINRYSNFITFDELTNNQLVHFKNSVGVRA